MLLSSKLYPIDLPQLSAYPIVSVLITNYNYQSFIQAAVESVLGQSYQNFEIIICDDGSSDNSLEVIENISKRDERIKFIAKQNGGQASALNEAFFASRGDIISILDSDDLFLQNKIKTVVDAFMKNSDVGLVAHKMKVVRDNKVLGYIPLQSMSEGWLVEDVMWGRTLFLPPASGLSVRREVAERCFPLPLHFRAGADRVLYFRCASITKVKSLNCVLGIYRVHNLSVSSKIDVDRNISLYKETVMDLKSFLENQHKIIIPNDYANLMGDLEINSLILYKKLLNKDPDYKYYIAKIKNYRIKIIWIILFMLPKSVSIILYNWWQGSSATRRLLHSFMDIIRRMKEII